MFEWQKLGLIFDPTAHNSIPWLQQFAQAPSVLIYDDFVRVYFSGRPAPDREGRYVSRVGYVDLNRKNLQEIMDISKEPILSLGETGTFDEFGTYPISVIRVDDRIVGYYGGWTRCESVPFNVAIGICESYDNGRSFKRIGKGPVLSYSAEEPFVISGPKIRKFNETYYLWYIAGTKWMMYEGKPEPVYKIRMAYSQDGLNWVKLNKNQIEDKLGIDEAQASPDVFYYDGYYHMFFCYRQPTDYRRNKSRSYRIGYAYSRDLVNWTRDDQQAGIDVSEDGWDSEMVAYPHVFELDGDVYMFYLGNEVGRYGFGMAKLKKA